MRPEHDRARARGKHAPPSNSPLQPPPTAAAVSQVLPSYAAVGAAERRAVRRRMSIHAEAVATYIDALAHLATSAPEARIGWRTRSTLPPPLK
jgi:hypothetical protein